MANENTKKLSDAGVSIWLDDLSRSIIQTGKLQDLVQNLNVVGLTTNPSIFANAIINDPLYQAEIEQAKNDGTNPLALLESLMVQDVKDACDIFANTFKQSGGHDGLVSIEVEPELAHDAAGTVKRAKELWDLIDRENVLIKIPATTAGLEAITETIALGISVNVTLIFSISRYRQVLSAHMHGLEKALTQGLDIKKINSVASVFISRFDTAVSEQISVNSNLQNVDNKIGVANAKLIYQANKEILSTERASYLRSQGANEQRLLWASTGVKSEALSPEYYVSELVAQNTVNTMPMQTLEAISKSMSFETDAAAARVAEAAQDMQYLTSNGVDYKELTHSLEEDGLSKFNEAWSELVDSIRFITSDQASAL